MPYFLLTAENTYFIVFNITCKNEALLYIVEYIHTNRRFRLLHRLEFAQWFLNVRLFTKTSLLKEGRKKNQQTHRLPPERWHSLWSSQKTRTQNRGPPLPWRLCQSSWYHLVRPKTPKAQKSFTLAFLLLTQFIEMSLWLCIFSLTSFDFPYFIILLSLLHFYN